MSEKLEIATFQLAVLRTELSNSRTLLSYTQASIALLVSAIAFMNLFNLSQILHLGCWLLIILAVVVVARGIFLYRKAKSLIENQRTSVSGT
ncbi:MAG: DUF202 domain-containing protein [Chloracidobacterium sp.]|nr:DUF202 domain-containing protein [Chloracidobacterium sp.]